VGEQLVGLGQYIKVPHSSKAEVALLIQDEWQQKGMGTWLMRYLVRIARQAGITGFDAEVLSDNRGMLAVFESLPYKMNMKLDSGSYSLTFDFEK
jgi:GNAT superfamily N-acetyltransferase